MEALVKIIEAVVWPLTLIIVVLLLRAPLSILVPTLKKLKYKDLELEFEREANKILAEAERDLPEIIKEPSPQGTDEEGTLFSRRRQEPVEEIITSWRNLELTMRKLAEPYHISTETSIHSLIQSLESKGLISSEISKITLDLSAFRNKVAHSDESTITYDVANKFILTVNRVKAAINA